MQTREASNTVLLPIVLQHSEAIAELIHCPDIFLILYLLTVPRSPLQGVECEGKGDTIEAKKQCCDRMVVLVFTNYIDSPLDPMGPHHLGYVR